MFYRNYKCYRLLRLWCLEKKILSDLQKKRFVILNESLKEEQLRLIKELLLMDEKIDVLSSSLTDDPPQKRQKVSIDSKSFVDSAQSLQDKRNEVYLQLMNMR